MDGYCDTRQQQADEFNEVDRFLRSSTNNFDFWRGAPPPRSPHRSPLTFPAENLNSPTNARDKHQPPFSNYDEERRLKANLVLPLAPTAASHSSGRGGGDQSSNNSNNPHPIYPVEYHPQQQQEPNYPPHHQQQQKYENRISASSLPFSKADKRRKSSAFKSLRSFLKKHLRLATNRNEENFIRTKKTSSSSLYNCTKPDYSSSNNINSGQFIDEVDSEDSTAQPLARAHSFSASKMRGDSFSAERRPAAAWGAPSASSRAAISAYTADNSRQRLRSASSSNHLPPSPRTSSSAILHHHYTGGSGGANGHYYGDASLSSPSKSSALISNRCDLNSPVRSSAAAMSSSRIAGRDLADLAKSATTSLSGPYRSSGVSTQQLAANPAESGVSLPRTQESNGRLSSQNTVQREHSKAIIADGQPTNVTETPCLNGILNHGNTCYMNALVQCLACIDRFAEYFVCQQFNSVSSPNSSPPSSLSKNSVTSILSSILQSLWFNVNADGACLKLLKFMASENLHFQLSSQQDAQESLIWVLDRIHEEIKDVRLCRADPSSKLCKSEEQLASDALKRVSGSNRSAIMDLFRAQFRSSMECSSCGFSNLTFDPYMTVSLSVLQTDIPRKTSTALFVPFFNQRQIVRYKMSLASPSEISSSRGITTVFNMKDKIMRSLGGSPENLVACQFSSTGQCIFVADDSRVNGAENISSIEYTMVEVPKLSEQQETQQDLIVAIVTHISGFFPNGSRRGLPYVVVLNRQWSYDRIAKCVMEKGSFLFRTPFTPLHDDFKLLLQHSTDGVLHLDHGVTMPLFNEWTGLSKRGFVLRLVVEWNSVAAVEYLRSESEPIVNDFTFEREFENGRDAANGAAVTLPNLLQDYIKAETVPDWKCPKCFKTSGQKELKFHSMPPVLVFHLKRFELLNDGATKKVDTRVQIPLDSLDMSPYISNPDSRFSTLKSQKENTNGFIRQHDFESSYPLYDLVGIVRHHGERANSGHYTATTRNPVDLRWRNFDDLKVTLVPNSGGDVRSSTDAYLLFYERRKSVVDGADIRANANGGFTSSRQCSRWFPAAVPKAVIAACEEQRRHSRDSLESRSERLRKELEEFSLLTAEERQRPIQSGASTFYTGSALAATNGSPGIARSYTEQLHHGDGSSQSQLTDKYGSSPARRNSMSSKSYPHQTSSAAHRDTAAADAMRPCPKVSSTSASPYQYYRDFGKAGGHILANNTSSPVKSAYYYESVGASPPISKINYSSERLPYGSGGTSSTQALPRELSIEPLRLTSGSGGARYVPASNYDVRIAASYKSGSTHPPSSTSYSAGYSTLPASPRRSKSYQTLSNGGLHRGASTTSTAMASAGYYSGDGSGSTGYSAYSPYSPTSSSISGGRSRSGARDHLVSSRSGVGDGGLSSKARHLITAYRH